MNIFNPYPMLLLLLMTSTSASGNSAINGYLSQARQIHVLQTEPLSRNSSWLQDAELRFNASDQDEQDLALRFRPRFGDQRSAQDRILELLDMQYTSVVNDQLNEELELRYIKLLDLIEDVSELDYLEQKTQQLRENLTLNRSLAQTENFNIADLQDAETEFQISQKQLKIMRSRVRNRRQSFAGVSVEQFEAFTSQWSQRVSEWDTMLVTASQLLHLVENDQLHDQRDQIDFQIAQQKLKLARGEANNWVKYIELKWAERESGDQETTLGLSIPLGREVLDVSQRAADLNRAGLSLQAGSMNNSRLLHRFISDLEWQQDQAGMLQAGKSLVEQQYLKLRDANQPEILIDLKHQALAYDLQIRRSHIRGLRAYIDLLHAVGYLAKKPLINWLLREQPRL